MNHWDPGESLSEAGRAALRHYVVALGAMNRRVNLLARSGEDLDWHIRHCLCIGWRGFPPGAHLVDFGTGGGLPAIPLAVRFPTCRVTAVDSTEKKVLAVRTMARRVGAANLTAWSGRAEHWSGNVYAAVSRATAPLSTLWEWTEPHLSGDAAPNTDLWSPGLICLKGGDLSDEIRAHRSAWPETTVHQYELAAIAGPEFEDKVLLHVTRTGKQG